MIRRLILLLVGTFLVVAAIPGIALADGHDDNNFLSILTFGQDLDCSEVGALRQTFAAHIDDQPRNRGSVRC